MPSSVWVNQPWNPYLSLRGSGKMLTSSYAIAENSLGKFKAFPWRWRLYVSTTAIVPSQVY